MERKASNKLAGNVRQDTGGGLPFCGAVVVVAICRGKGESGEGAVIRMGSKWMDELMRKIN